MAENTENNSGGDNGEEEQNNQPDFMNMSDEDFLRDADSLLEEVQDDAGTDDDGDEGSGEPAEEESADSDEGGEKDDDAPGDEEGSDSEDENDNADEGDGEDSDSDDDGDPDGDDDADDDSADDDPEDEDSDSENDYEKLYKEVTKPFKANGKTMQVDKPEDIVRLMQMGANYNRKMAAMKPGLKVLKMLENNELMSEKDLSFLIDVRKGDKAAITKLLKDSKVDLDDIDLEQESDYKASDHSVSDGEVELDTIVDELRDSENFTKTLDVVTKKWDADSKQIVADSPQLLKVIDGHMGNGIYDRISTEVEKERMLGGLAGVSDIDAYKQIGDRLHSEGAFNDLFQNQEKQSQDKPAKRTVPKAKKAADDAKRRAKRRAASPSKQASPAPAKNADFNPLSMSDEEFEKEIASNLL